MCVSVCVAFLVFFVCVCLCMSMGHVPDTNKDYTTTTTDDDDVF